MYVFDKNKLPALNMPAPEFNEKNIKAFYRPDVIDGSFTENYGGWPRNDIALINEQTSLEAAKVMLDNLAQMPQSTENAGLSDAEIMLSHRSKYCQSASEVTEWLENQLALRDSRSSSEDVVKDGVIDFSENKDETE